MRGERERREPRAGPRGYFLLGAIGPKVPPTLEAVGALAALRPQGQTVTGSIDPHMTPLFQRPRRAVHLDGNGGLAGRGEVPLAPQRPGLLKAPAYALPSKVFDVSHVIEAVLAAHLPRSPFGLADPSHVEGCHLCSVYQVSGFATILHKRIGGLPPPPFVKGRSAFPLDKLPPALAAGQGFGRPSPEPAFSLEMNMTQREPFSYERLHPKTRDAFRLLETRLRERWEAGLTPTLFKPFEGFRSNDRQEYLFRVEKTTKARAWQSAHNYGLAVDFVPLRDPASAADTWDWSNHHDWQTLKEIATASGLLAPIDWDKPHICHPIWFAIKGHVL